MPRKRAAETSHRLCHLRGALDTFIAFKSINAIIRCFSLLTFVRLRHFRHSPYSSFHFKLVSALFICQSTDIHSIFSHHAERSTSHAINKSKNLICDLELFRRVLSFLLFGILRGQGTLKLFQILKNQHIMKSIHQKWDVPVFGTWIPNSDQEKMNSI